MSVPGISFKSSNVAKAERQELKKAREQYLDQVKSEYERDQRKKEQAKKRGEDTWMLPSLNVRLEKDQEKSKSKKHKKEKKKKHKKEKKHKKHKKRHKESSSGSDSDDSGGEKVWAEKTTGSPSPAASSSVKGPSLPDGSGPKPQAIQRDSWMTAPMDLVPTITRQEIRDKNKEKEKEAEDVNLLDQPGQHSRELNPYWKDGGEGMPEEEARKERKAEPRSAGSGVAGDGGASWLRRAYQRCVEQAKEEGRSLEDIAAERYGSLEKLESMLREAEGQGGRSQRGNRNWQQRPAGNNDRNNRDSDRARNSDRAANSNRDRDNDRTSNSNIDSNKDLGRDSSHERDSRRDRNSDRIKDSERNSESSKKYDRDSKSDRDRVGDRDYERDRDRYRRGGSRERDREGNRHKGSDRDSSRSSENKYKSMSSRFMKPGDDSERTSSSSRSSTSDRQGERSQGWKKPGFLKPSEDGEKAPRRTGFRKPGGDTPDQRESHRERDSESSRTTKRFLKPGEDDARSERRESDRDRQREKVCGWKKEEFRRPKEEEKKESRQRNQSSDSSSSSSSSSDSEEEEEQERHQREKSPSPEVEVLTEQQMNELGAKIIKAEIMGNQAIADKLKAQIAGARDAQSKQKSKPPKPASQGTQKCKPEEGEEDEDEDVVVLTRTDRRGMVRPLPEREHAEEPRGGRRKKKKVATHDKDGQRERYFADDDRFDLKDMVQREKMSTAEDQNMMFARLAGRSVEKTDDDYQIDDVFVRRANKQMSDSRMEDRERAMAVHETQKMAQTLEKCTFCFGNVAKHLIISIGKKVYLSLPNGRSLTEGHCLIVPMQHVVSSTVMDEDVWSEVQSFRRALTKMFQDKDEDCVFMETSMKLRHKPHTCIECVPMPREVGDMAPIYFKKAIMESESEWSQNKKLVDISQKDIRKSVPKGFPYFSVDFGMQGGFAHVIEDEMIFQSYFGKEIVGGMLDLEPRLWRKPWKESFEDQRKKVLQFAESWKAYDWTQNLDETD